MVKNPLINYSVQIRILIRIILDPDHLRGGPSHMYTLYVKNRVKSEQ